MLKLRFSKPSVKTYMDGKITVCRYNCTLLNNNTKCVIAEYTSTGTAKCADGDTIDADYGRKLADSRAKLTAYKVAEGFVDYDNAVELYNKADEALEFADSMIYLKNKEKEHIEYLKNELPE